MITLWYDQTLLKPIGPIPPNWARAVGIYSQLFKYTLQVLQKTTMGPAPPKVHPVYSPQNNDGYSVLLVSFRAKYIYNTPDTNT